MAQIVVIAPRRLRVQALCFVLLLSSISYWSPAHTAEQEVAFSQSFAQWLESPRLAVGSTALSAKPFHDFYAARQYQAVWTDANGLNARAVRALDVIAQAEDDGLSPQYYEIDTINRLGALAHADASRRLQARLSLEVLTSQAIMEYAQDLRHGRMNPERSANKTAAETERLSLLSAAANARDTARYLAALSPQTPEYLSLKASLLYYQTLAEKGGWPVFAVGKPIKPGMADVRLATLATILQQTGDLPEDATISTTAYEGALVEAIKRFQERHLLDADGIIGKTTQLALATPAEQRVAQIGAALERMRWMPDTLGARYVLVNIPAYSLRAVDGSRQLSMDVIVGKPDSRTPIFSKAITQVVLNPSWGVPPRIAANEMLPKIRKDPGYLTRAGYTLSANGETLDPYAVDWDSLSQDYFPYSLRQKPGDGNALGKVKFTIPDSDNIYLHDTTRPELFARSARSLSHGCVRLSDPEALTQFVLAHENGWSKETITRAYESEQSRTIPIAPLPVHLVYWTSWTDTQGRLYFARDIYGYDKALVTAMTPPPASKEVAAIRVAMQ